MGVEDRNWGGQIICLRCYMFMVSNQRYFFSRKRKRKPLMTAQRFHGNLGVQDSEVHWLRCPYFRYHSFPVSVIILHRRYIVPVNVAFSGSVVGSVYGMWLLVDLRAEAGLGQVEAPHHFPCVWNPLFGHHSHSGMCFRIVALREQRGVDWDHLDWMCDYPVKVSV